MKNVHTKIIFFPTKTHTQKEEKIQQINRSKNWCREKIEKYWLPPIAKELNPPWCLTHTLAVNHKEIKNILN